MGKFKFESGEFRLQDFFVRRITVVAGVMNDSFLRPSGYDSLNQSLLVVVSR